MVIKRVFCSMVSLAVSQGAFAQVRAVGAGYPKSESLVVDYDKTSKTLQVIDYDLNNANSIQQLIGDAEALLNSKSVFTENLGKGEIKTLKAIQKKAQQLLSASSKDQKKVLKTEISYLLFGFSSEYSIPGDVELDVLELPGKLNPAIGQGLVPARNIDKDGNPIQPSTYWTNPGNISDKDLYTGFSRTGRFSPKKICKFEAPKGGYGVRPGTEIKCDGQKVKLKWSDESVVEPFVTRIFWALGYNTQIADYVDGIKMKYDRDFFTRFNEREPLKTRITVLGTVKVMTHTTGFGSYDPFSFVEFAVMKDGSKISADQLKEMLVQNKDVLLNESYSKDVEEKIDYLALKPGSVKFAKEGEVNAGGWDFGSQKQDELREVRGIAVLSAWLNSFVFAWENNKLKLVEEGEELKLRHVISDLGSGLGSASNTLQITNGEVNAFPWSFSSGKSRAELIPGSTTAMKIDEYGFAFEHVTNTAHNRAFAQLAYEDVIWMTKLLKQLTPKQIQLALAASGLNAAEVVMYTEKLIYRRDKMIYDLGKRKDLKNQMPYKRPPVINRDFAVEPLVLQLPDGTTKTIDDGTCKIQDSEVVCVKPRVIPKI